jgi:peptidase E
MKQIIALGGGGFSTDTKNQAIDQYVLDQSIDHPPKICFLPTASGDAKGYIELFYRAFNNLNCIPTHLSLFSLSTTDLEGFLLGQDVIYVGGGNTRSMLAVWRAWGLDSILKQAWEKEVVLAGISAGAICWFEQGLTDSIPGEFSPIDCLGILPGSCSPHFTSEPKRRIMYRKLIKERQLLPGYGIDDHAAIHSINSEMLRVVSTQPGATVHHIDLTLQETVREEALKYYMLPPVPTVDN